MEGVSEGKKMERKKQEKKGAVNITYQILIPLKLMAV